MILRQSRGEPMVLGRIGGALILIAALQLAAVSSATAGPGPGVARPSPAWVRDGVIYQVNLRAFSARGDFQGVTSRLDELKDLGATVLWLMPIHPVGREKRKGRLGSPYSVRDYYRIDPAYGGMAGLQQLVKQAHRRGLRVILDVVLNHTAWDNPWIKKHPGFYTRDAAGRVVSPYPGWSDVADLDYSSPELRREMIAVLKHWVRQADLDGFRCDVAGLVPTGFWEQASAALRAMKPDLLLLAEADKPELLLKAFDADYAFGFHAELGRVLQGMRPASSLRELWDAEHAKWPRGALRMYFSDNHDERRAVARFGERPALVASALLFTLDGIPMLYNGMEIGDTAESGAPALFDRRPIAWSFGQRRPWGRPFYKALAALRSTHQALRRGTTKWLPNADQRRVLSFLRATRQEQLLVAVNLSSLRFRGQVGVANLAEFREVGPRFPLPTAPGSSRLELVSFPPPAGSRLELPAWSVRVFARGGPR